MTLASTASLAGRFRSGPEALRQCIAWNAANRLKSEPHVVDRFVALTMSSADVTTRIWRRSSACRVPRHPDCGRVAVPRCATTLRAERSDMNAARFTMKAGRSDTTAARFTMNVARLTMSAGRSSTTAARRPTTAVPVIMTAVHVPLTADGFTLTAGRLTTAVCAITVGAARSTMTPAPSTMTTAYDTMHAEQASPKPAIDSSDRPWCPLPDIGPPEGGPHIRAGDRSCRTRSLWRGARGSGDRRSRSRSGDQLADPCDARHG